MTRVPDSQYLHRPVFLMHTALTCLFDESAPPASNPSSA